jgi:hypothetical protein
MISGPNDRLTCIVAAIILDLFQADELIRFTPSTDRLMLDRAVPALFGV